MKETYTCTWWSWRCGLLASRGDTCQKRHIYLKRDVYIWKDTGQETYKRDRPTLDTNWSWRRSLITLRMRNMSNEAYTWKKTYVYMKKDLQKRCTDAYTRWRWTCSLIALRIMKMSREMYTRNKRDLLTPAKRDLLPGHSKDTTKQTQFTDICVFVQWRSAQNEPLPGHYLAGHSSLYKYTYVCK